MNPTITLALDVDAEVDRVYDIVSTTEGHRSFWTADCDITGDRARFGFEAAPVDLHADVTAIPGKLVRMTVTSGFPFWEGSTWEWELGPAQRAESGTGVMFRHHGFGEGYAEADLAYTAQTWAMILDRLASHARSGVAEPYFPAA